MEEKSGLKKIMSKNEELFNRQQEKKSRQLRRVMLMAFTDKPPTYYNMYNKGRG